MFVLVHNKVSSTYSGHSSGGICFLGCNSCEPLPCVIQKFKLHKKKTNHQQRKRQQQSVGRLLTNLNCWEIGSKPLRRSMLANEPGMSDASNLASDFSVFQFSDRSHFLNAGTKWCDHLGSWHCSYTNVWNLFVRTPNGSMNNARPLGLRWAAISLNALRISFTQCNTEHEVTTSYLEGKGSTNALDKFVTSPCTKNRFFSSLNLDRAALIMESDKSIPTAIVLGDRAKLFFIRYVSFPSPHPTSRKQRGSSEACTTSLVEVPRHCFRFGKILGCSSRN